MEYTIKAMLEYVAVNYHWRVGDRFRVTNNKNINALVGDVGKITGMVMISTGRTDVLFIAEIFAPEGNYAITLRHTEFSNIQPT